MVAHCQYSRLSISFSLYSGQLVVPHAHHTLRWAYSMITVIMQMGKQRNLHFLSPNPSSPTFPKKWKRSGGWVMRYGLSLFGGFPPNPIPGLIRRNPNSSSARDTSPPLSHPGLKRLQQQLMLIPDQRLWMARSTLLVTVTGLSDLVPVRRHSENHAVRFIRVCETHLPHNCCHGCCIVSFTGGCPLSTFFSLSSTNSKMYYVRKMMMRK